MVQLASLSICFSNGPERIPEDMFSQQPNVQLLKAEKMQCKKHDQDVEQGHKAPVGCIKAWLGAERQRDASPVGNCRGSENTKS